MCYGAKIATQQLFSQLLFLFYNFCFIRSFKLSTILLPDTTFSVSAAKAFFEAAKRPEVRQAAVAAAKNPFVRDVAKSAAKNPETRNQLIAALEKQTSPAVKPKYDSVAPTPPPPPPHRGAAAYSDASASYSNSSYSPSITSKPLPPAPSTSSYATAPAPPSKIGYPSLVNELQELQLNSQGESLMEAGKFVAYPSDSVVLRCLFFLECVLFRKATAI
ncbi:unnamed protein product [Heligmosomoides polygyrus]|uniref:DM14 domain-containing protein n=1 Tax=Heligmosomoides polygyrus TaxID=6339 RepID=A0A183FAS8_HELPZ|nr:unnamed protein product [Heligmosomoides polygyrus]